jgi:ABC-type lipoprotein export system ATPase subunit/bifunctional DNA-binding transcriptional regulator/antitoxin component of YhaV-PrlF toxin-antitoxin module
MDDQNIILCDGLVKIYKIANLEVVALQGLDLLVRRGELLGIVGASGSGKSTLMNILGGLDRPSAGRVTVDGKDLLKMSDAELNSYRSTRVGFVWQQGARNLIPYLSALENVKLPITIAGQVSKETNRRAEMLLDSVGLGERKHHRLVEMSGGEQQRVAIAVSLANHPALLLADEPTGEVDSNTAHQIFDIFKELNKQMGLTTIIVSHDQTIARHVDRVVAIRDGKTSSETVRQTVAAQPTPEGAVEGEAQTEAKPQEMTFEEVVLLDSAGRLQVPREYLERLSIQRRVYVEMTDDGILIRPAAPSERENALVASVGPNAQAPEKESRLRGLLNRFRKSDSSRRQS